MMMVKVGELIKELRNITAFGALLCALWILFSFNIQATRISATQVEDLVAFLMLRDYIRSGNPLLDCLRTYNIDSCEGALNNPWLANGGNPSGMGVEVEFIRVKDFEKAELRRNGNEWRSDDGLAFVTKEKPVTFWKLSRPVTDGDDWPAAISFSGYVVVVSETGALDVLYAKCWLYTCFDRGSERIRDATLWLGSIGRPALTPLTK